MTGWTSTWTSPVAVNAGGDLGFLLPEYITGVVVDSMLCVGWTCEEEEDGWE